MKGLHYWRDHNGTWWRVPQIKDRLRPHQIKGHAALRDFVVARDKCCAWCGATTNLVADHIRSKRNGGMHHPHNLQALCFSCNSKKSNAVDRKTSKRTHAVTHNDLMHMKRVCARAVAAKPATEVLDELEAAAKALADFDANTPLLHMVELLARMQIVERQATLLLGEAKVSKERKRQLLKLEERLDRG